MTAQRLWSAITILTALTIFVPISDRLTAQNAAMPVAAPSAPVSALIREQAGAILPATVFFRGKTTTIQARNSGGLRMFSGKLVLMAAVDTGGYSSAIAERYQAYLITEVPLEIDFQTLAPGAYGFGFLSDGTLRIMDVGGNEVLETKTTKDPALVRPNPLQLVLDPKAGTARLYMGRAYVTFRPIDR